MKVDRLFAVILIGLILISTTACEKPNTTSRENSASIQTKDKFSESNYIVMDIEQVGLEHQTVLYTAWGRFTAEDNEEKDLLRNQCCYVTVNMKNEEDTYETDLNMIFSLNGNVISSKIDTVVVGDSQRITVGSLNAVDIDNDGLDELFLNFACGNGSSSTRVYKVKNEQIKLVYDFDDGSLNLAETLGYSLRFKDKKYVIVNSYTGMKTVCDLSQLYSNEFFDKNGKLTDEYLSQLLLTNIYDCSIVNDGENKNIEFYSPATLSNSYFCTLKTVVRLDEDLNLTVLDSSVIA